ncbi:hypothetical protein PS1_009568 [Malus domestica]
MKRIFSAAFVASKKLYLALNKEPQDDRDPSRICDVAFNYVNVVTGYNSTTKYQDKESQTLGKSIESKHLRVKSRWGFQGNGASGNTKFGR